MSVKTRVRDIGSFERVDGVWIGRLLVPILLLGLWQAASLVASEYALASPLETYRAIVRGFEAGWMVEDGFLTVVELAFAYVFAVVSGIWIGVILGLNDFWEEVFEPILLGVYSIPKVTLFPIFLLLFGLGVDSKIAFGWFHGVFPVAILTMTAMDSVEEEHLKVAKSMGLSRWRTFREVIFPSILPGLVIGMRLGFSLTFLGVVLGEMFAARSGLGYRLMEFMESVQVAPMLAIITVLVLLAAVVNAVFYAIEQRLSARGHETADMSI